MRLFILALACLNAVALPLAWGDESAPTAPAATPAAPASSPSASAAATPASAASAPAPAPQQQVAPVSAEEADRYFRAKGYTVRVVNGEKLYCRHEEVLGSRLQGAVQCSPAEQLRVQEQQSQLDIQRTQRGNFGKMKGGD